MGFLLAALSKFTGINLSDKTIRILLDLLIILAVLAALWWFRADIKKSAFNEFYAQEVAAQIADKDEQIHVLQLANQAQIKQLMQMEETKKATDKKFDAVRNDLRNKKSADGPEDQIVIDAYDAIRNLRGNPNAPKP